MELQRHPQTPRLELLCVVCQGAAVRGRDEGGAVELHVEPARVLELVMLNDEGGGRQEQH